MPSSEDEIALREKVFRIYRIYLWINLIWYALVFLLGITVLYALGILLGDFDLQSSTSLTLLFGGLLLITTAIIFGLANFRFLKKRLESSTWLFHYLNILFGISSFILAPLCLWLAIRWNDPAVKKHFTEQKFEL
jgi:hypothetical protein